jgi:uncharacterized protein
MPTMYRVDILESKLKEMMERTSGIQGTVVVSIEGFVVAAYPPADHHADMRGTYHRTSTPQIAAMAATMVALGEQTLTRLAQGKIQRLMVEGEDGAMIVYPINRNAALAAMIDKKAKVGLTLMAIARTAVTLGDILAGTD